MTLMLTDINESGLDVHPHVGLDLPPTHQPAVYQLRLPRENPDLVSPSPVPIAYSAVPNQTRVSLSFHT